MLKDRRYKNRFEYSAELKKYVPKKRIKNDEFLQIQYNYAKEIPVCYIVKVPMYFYGPLAVETFEKDGANPTRYDMETVWDARKQAVKNWKDFYPTEDELQKEKEKREKELAKERERKEKEAQKEAERKEKEEARRQRQLERERRRDSRN